MTPNRNLSTDPIYLSVVVPCFNEEEVLPVFLSRMFAACASALEPGLPWEILLVNDGSRDKSQNVMVDFAKHHAEIVVLNLARNYGHQIALTAGLLACRGDLILILDADLQDPPELLSAMLAAMREQSADVVFGQRKARPGETPLKLASAALFYRLLNNLVDVHIPVDTGDFRLITRRALNILNSMPEQHRFIRGMISWIGLHQIPFSYDRDIRFAGESKYPLGKMLGFAVDAVTSFSVKPLRLASWIGLLAGSIGFMTLIYTLGSWFRGSVVQGWTSAVSLILVLGGFQLLMLGVMGEYLGRLYIESKRRPLFVVDEIITFPSTDRERRLQTEISPQGASGNNQNMTAAC